MDRMREKCDESAKVTDCLDDEVLCFYAEALQGAHRRIKEGQRVTYVIEIDATGRRFATDIRFEDDDEQQLL